MDNKAIFVMVVLVVSLSMITLGCTGKVSNAPAPTGNPTVAPAPTSTINPPTPTPQASINATGANASLYDDSLVNISGESDESLPEDAIPTPDAGQ